MPFLTLANWGNLHRAGAAQEPQDCKEALPDQGWSNTAGPAFPLLLDLLNYELKVEYSLHGPQQTRHHSGLHKSLGPTPLVATLQRTSNVKTASPSWLK